MAEAECGRIYGSQKKVNMVEGVFVNVDLKITKQRWKQLYVIVDHKNSDGIFKRFMLHIKSVLAEPFPTPVPVNLPATAPLFTATTTTGIPSNPFISVHADTSTPVDPEPVPTTTTTTVSPTLLSTTNTVPYNCPTTVFPSPDPIIITNVPSNTPTPVFPEPDTTTTTCVYSNPPTQHSPVPDPTPPPTPVSPVHDTPP